MTKTFRELLPKLRAERGWSRPRLSREASEISPSGASIAQIAAIERGVRYPSGPTIAVLCRAMSIDPMEIPEYRLACARRTLDERQVGLERAIEALDKAGDRIEPETCQFSESA